jgi:hypothetical protein
MSWIHEIMVLICQPIVHAAGLAGVDEDGSWYYQILDQFTVLTGWCTIE